MNTVIFTVIVVGSVLLGILVDVAYKRGARKKLVGRPRRSSLEFGQRFYPCQAEVAAQVRDILSRNLPVDLSQLEPGDQPVADLHMDDLDSMSTVEFVIALEEKFDISIADADAEKMRTFDDICTHVIAQLKEKKVK